MKVQMMIRGCPICKTSKNSQLFSESNYNLEKLGEFGFASRKMPEYMHYKLLTCNSCDLLYASELPKESFLETAYHEAAFDSAKEAELASLTYLKFLERFLERMPGRDGAIDIGTGDGVFLERLLEAKFTNVRGVEPSHAPVESAKPEIKPLIKLGFFNSNDFAEDSVCLISCFQTLEHVSEPLELCKNAVTLLKHGGCAYFVVHNRRALSAKLLGKKSPIFDIEHLQLFSEKSARNLLVSAGLSGIQIRRIYNSYPLNYWLKLFPFPIKIKPSILKFAEFCGLGKILITIPAGNLAVVGFKK